MNVYHLTPSKVSNRWDSYAGCVVCAPDEASARLIHPSSLPSWQWDPKREAWRAFYGGIWLENKDWCNPEDVQVVLVGQALPDRGPGVILSDCIRG